jgi:hypothetical protein
MLRLRRVKEKCPSTSPEILLSVNARLTFRRSRTQFGVNFVASLAGEMRLRSAA